MRFWGGNGFRPAKPAAWRFQVAFLRPVFRLPEIKRGKHSNAG
ncbi:hypothetical protein [Eikenella halliae]|nr:hypothetical protein [Eikenella halliae]